MIKTKEENGRKQNKDDKREGTGIYRKGNDGRGKILKANGR